MGHVLLDACRGDCLLVLVGIDGCLPMVAVGLGTGQPRGHSCVSANCRTPEMTAQMAAQAQQLQEQVAEMLEQFEEQMSTILENINEADQAFGNVDGRLVRLIYF